MSTKNVYFYKVSLFSSNPSMEHSIGELKALFDHIFTTNVLNHAIALSQDDIEPMTLDIIDNNDEYLFARLSKKRPNNTLQKRDYDTLAIDDVLAADELGNKGIEMFTYCILGYKHGVLSIANSKGAPKENSLNRLFQLYNNNYYLDIDPVPNSDLIRELYDSDSSVINRICVEVPTPDATVLEQALKTTDSELLNVVGSNTQSVVFEIKPQYRSELTEDPKLVKRLIDAFRTSRDSFSKVVLHGKTAHRRKQVGYDLFEEYFKYPIEITEYHQEDNRKVEYPKEQIQMDYRGNMMNVYNEFKNIILAFCDRAPTE